MLFQTCMTCGTRKKQFRKIFVVVFVCLFLHTIKVNGDQCVLGSIDIYCMNKNELNIFYNVFCVQLKKVSLMGLEQH